MTGRHAVRRPPPHWITYRPYSGVWIATAAAVFLVAAAGTVAAIGTVVAPRVQATAAPDPPQAATDALNGPTSDTPTPAPDTERSTIATSAPRTASKVPARVALTRSVTPTPSEGASAGPLAAAPSTTAGPTTTAPVQTTTATVTETTTAAPTTSAATSSASNTPTDTLPTPTIVRQWRRAPGVLETPPRALTQRSPTRSEGHA